MQLSDVGTFAGLVTALHYGVFRFAAEEATLLDLFKCSTVKNIQSRQGEMLFDSD